jgi:Carboxypeptidase regulatory-like domain/TonB-dependent Receptor Plug Domain
MQGFRKGWLLSGVLLLLVVTIPVCAQKISGDIAGDVTDSTGAVVANATVTAEKLDTRLLRSATASSTGSFRIPELPIGIYKVSVSAPGFKTTVRNMEVSAAALTHADFVLQVGERTETVEVEGAAPLVELSPNDNNYIDRAKIEALPINGRDLNSLIAVTPGVQRTPGGGFLAISINGSRTTSNNYLIDGLYNNDRYYGDQSLGQPGVTGIPAVIFPPEAIQEVGIQQTPSAEFGVKGGAPINMVMKSGNNGLHGDARWVRHTSFADAANYFSKRSGCSDPGSCQPTPLRNMQFGGTLGGPIVKDRTFFFVFYEGRRGSFPFPTRLMCRPRVTQLLPTICQPAQRVKTC